MVPLQQHAMLLAVKYCGEDLLGISSVKDHRSRTQSGTIFCIQYYSVNPLQLLGLSD